jgi:hypothetical protein
LLLGTFAGCRFAAHAWLVEGCVARANACARTRPARLNTQATPFIDLFQRYARSHMWYGAQLLLMLLVAVICGLQVAPLLLFANIIAIFALLVAPFWCAGGEGAAARAVAGWWWGAPQELYALHACMCSLATACNGCVYACCACLPARAQVQPVLI